MNYTPEDLECWNRAKELLRADFALPLYAAWFKNLELYARSGDTIVLAIDNEIALSTLRQRYMSTLDNVLRRTFERVFDIVIAMGDELTTQVERLSKTLINPKFTFDNFVVGSSNSFAYAAAMSVAEAPGEDYNPLFLYGGVGLGKTHLMNAIGNYISLRDPRKNVLFITSEMFTNEFIEALAKKRNSALRERMRTVDVFMVDDIQFLAKTVATQEEFFHTFNDLRTKGKQIIISSDRPPRELPAIEERLRSRFECGLTVDIRRPDFETRVAILRRKCEDEDIEAEDGVLEYIAERVENNIRELEGALNRLHAQSDMMGEEMTEQFAQEALRDILPQQARRIATPQTILKCVSEKYLVSVEDILSQKRSRAIAMARQVAMYIMREKTQLSTTAIGKELGDRDHTTIMHGCDKISTMIDGDATFKRGIEELISDITGK